MRSGEGHTRMGYGSCLLVNGCANGDWRVRLCLGRMFSSYARGFLIHELHHLTPVLTNMLRFLLRTPLPAVTLPDMESQYPAVLQSTRCMQSHLDMSHVICCL